MTRSPLPCPALAVERAPAGDRPRLLVSVREAREADEALAGGADWIDLKEPSRGALGPVEAEVAREVVEFVAGRAPVSAAGGELRQWPGSAARELLSVAGISHLKLGLAGCRDTAWQPAWLVAHAEAESAGKELVAVIYADDRLANSLPLTEILSFIGSAPSGWILVDTFDKRSGALTDRLDAATLYALFAAATACGKQTMAAGKLRADSLGELPLELIDMVGVRGAACRGERESAICRKRVRRLREALDELCRDGGAVSRAARRVNPSGAAFFGA